MGATFSWAFCYLQGTAFLLSWALQSVQCWGGKEHIRVALGHHRAAAKDSGPTTPAGWTWWERRVSGSCRGREMLMEKEEGWGQGDGKGGGWGTG